MNKDAVKPNKEQQQVIDTIDGPVLVVAGAGTGKTATVVKRIEHIIKDGYARAWQVLAITFTNKAAGELRERLENTIGVRLMTFGLILFTVCVHVCSAATQTVLATLSTLLFMTPTTKSEL